MIRRFLIAAPLLLASTLAQAVEAPPAMRAFVETDIMAWAESAQIVEAINGQNATTGDATQAQIDEWDAAWRAQVGQADQPLITQVTSSPLSVFLQQQVEASGGLNTEIFVMDARGLNVASSGVTSDYWQGDEDKHSKTYAQGPGAIFVDEVEIDESAQTYQGQVSVALSDPATGQVIGAMTIGLNAEMFF